MPDSTLQHLQPQDLMDRDLSEIVTDALARWENLTGVSLDTENTSFRFGDLDIRHMNEVMNRMMALEPDGRTALMLLECFLRDFLEGKQFTAASIMRDYNAMMIFLRRAEELFSIVQSDRAVAEIASFRARLAESLTHYRIESPDTHEMVRESEAVPFLRRDALEAMERLTPYQFLKGPPSTVPAQVIDHVYVAWDINDLLIGLRDMPVSGIAVVLLRNPANPDRSYFCFGMRNGENVVLFTDKTKPVYPGQDDVLAARGARAIGRRFAARAWANHFPYQLIPTSVDENGDTVFEKERLLTLSGKTLQPLMRIGDLPAHQAIWITMMLSLINERFWRQEWQAEALSYSGQMIRQRSLLTQDRQGGALEIAKEYQQVALEPVTLSEVTAEAMAKQACSGRVTSTNAWLEERYRDQAPEEILNLWFSDADETLMLPDTRARSDGFRSSRSLELARALPGGAVAVKMGGLPSWGAPRGYRLLSFDPGEFGAEADLGKDRLYIARHNLAMFVQKSANDEYEARKDEVKSWYRATLAGKRAHLLDLATQHLAGKTPFEARKNTLQPVRMGDVAEDDWRYTQYPQNMLGEPDSKAKYGHSCLVTGASAVKWRIDYVMRDTDDLCRLLGLPREELPDVLQNWTWEKADYHGNHLLDRVDPMASQVNNPWMKLGLNVTFFLSKRGKSLLEKNAGHLLEKEHGSVMRNGVSDV